MRETRRLLSQEAEELVESSIECSWEGRYLATEFSHRKPSITSVGYAFVEMCGDKRHESSCLKWNLGFILDFSLSH